MKIESVILVLVALLLMGVVIKRGPGGGAGLVFGTESSSGIDYPAHPTSGAQLCWKEATGSTGVAEPLPDTVCHQIISEVDNGSANTVRTINSEGVLACQWFYTYIADTGFAAADQYFAIFDHVIATAVSTTPNTAMRACPVESGANGCEIERVGVVNEQIPSASDNECLLRIGLSTDNDASTVEEQLTSTNLYIGPLGFPGNTAGDLRCVSAGCTADGTPQEPGDRLYVDVNEVVDADEQMVWQVIDPDGAGTGCAGSTNCDCTGIDNWTVATLICWTPDES